MGIYNMMMKLLIAAFVVIAAVDAVPVQLSPEVVQQLSSGVQEGIKDLNDMISNEKKEESLMVDVKTSIEGLPNAQKGHEKDEQQAIADARNFMRSNKSWIPH